MKNCSIQTHTHTHKPQMLLPLYLIHNQIQSYKTFSWRMLRSVNVDCRINMLDLFYQKGKKDPYFLCLCFCLHLIFATSVLFGTDSEYFQTEWFTTISKVMHVFGSTDGVYSWIFFVSDEEYACQQLSEQNPSTKHWLHSFATGS